jgi:hypothetical protein
MAKDNLKKKQPGSILGDITPDTENPLPGDPAGSDEDEDLESIESMSGGSQHGDSKHAGSRDVTEGVTGGTGTETGGTRNLRQGTGATGGDIGNRPEVYKPR